MYIPLRMSFEIHGVNQGPTGSFVRENYAIDNSNPDAMFSEGGIEAIEEAHRAYVEAGANIGMAATFRLTDFRVANSEIPTDWSHSPGRRYFLDHVTAERNSLAVRVARSVFGRDGIVAGSVAPITDTSGADDQYWSDLGANQVDFAMTRHRPQVKVLADAGVDVLWGEAFRYRNEAIALARLAKEFGVRALMVCFEATKYGFPDPVGQESYLFGDMRRDLQAEIGRNGTSVYVGANCAGVTAVEGILQRHDKLDAAYPNSLDFGRIPNDGSKREFWPFVEREEELDEAGRARLAEMRATLATTREQFEDFWKKALDAGVRVISVCCGGTPQLVSAAHAVYRQRR